MLRTAQKIQIQGPYSRLMADFINDEVFSEV